MSEGVGSFHPFPVIVMSVDTFFFVAVVVVCSGWMAADNFEFSLSGSATSTGDSVRSRILPKPSGVIASEVSSPVVVPPARRT